jgi:CheY-like chemotaxis protein
MTTVLIIEDDELILRMYQKIFTAEGYEVEIASNGEEGLERARATKPNLILLDVMMPKLNGLEMLKQLKSIPEVEKIPVVVLTNLSGTADAETALSLGAVKFINKSDYRPKEVFDIVKEILAGYTRNDIPAISHRQPRKNSGKSHKRR